jgi:hypothetical protein
MMAEKMNISSNAKWSLLLSTLLLTSCSVVRNGSNSQLQTGEYFFRQEEKKYQKAFVDIQDDTVVVFELSGNLFPVQKGKTQIFQGRGIDVDVITVPVKFRPGISNSPRQLNANINGNIFLGYRIDRFAIEFANTPAGIRKNQKHRALSLGVFGGMGNAYVNPWTTNYQTTDEYEAFILSRGIALMAGINNLTVGLGVGWDYLTDRDKKIWIYQNKPWLGLTVGLNLN